jgi:branched-chain amino acid transport system ATP-binding protein
MVLLEVKNIEASYGKIKVLWGVNLNINKGEIVGLIGPNGAGKTTLIKTIMNIIKPSNGLIKYEGNIISGMPTHKVAKLGITMVPEGGGIIPKLSVIENLEVAITTEEAKRKKKDTLELVFSLFPILKDRKNQLGGTLSGGEQRMLAIARALMLRPKLLMIDELSLGLAPKAVDQLYKILKELHKSENISLIIVEQFVKRVLELANRGYLIEKGIIVLEGESTKLLKDDYIKKVYIS